MKTTYFFVNINFISRTFHSGAVKTLAIPTMKRNMPFLKSIFAIIKCPQVQSSFKAKKIIFNFKIYSYIEDLSERKKNEWKI